MRTLYRARTIHTQSYPATGEWMLVDGRHVQRVGTGEAPEADRVIDLPGATIIPGFIDTHVHLTATGIALANRDVETADGARALMAIARARAAREEGPIFLQGYDETTFVRRLHVTERPIASSIDAAAAARASTLTILETLTEDEWTRTGTHAEQGPGGIAAGGGPSGELRDQHGGAVVAEQGLSAGEGAGQGQGK